MSLKVQSFWYGADLTPLEQCCISSFIEHGHTFEMYCYEEIRSAPSGVVFHDAAPILPLSEMKLCQESYAMSADLFRYRLLAERGGIWTDVDMYCVGEFYFNQPLLFASELTPDGNTKVTNSVMYAEQGSEVMNALANACKRMDRQNLPWGATGPLLVQTMVEQLGLYEFVATPDVFCPHPWWDVTKLTEKGFEPEVTANTKAIHLWNNCWKESGLDKKAKYPGSWYGKITSSCV